MAEESWPTTASGRSISDTQWERMAPGFALDGIIGTALDTSVVYADSTGMQVKIRANKEGNLRGHGWWSGTSEFTRSIGPNTSGSTRIDLVVLKLTRAGRTVSIVVKPGIPGAGAPGLTQDPLSSGSGVWEMAVTQVTVPHNATTISAAQVVNLAQYLSPQPALSRSKLISFPAGTINPARNFSNTAAPASDTESTPGFFPGTRTTFTKMSADSDLEFDVRLSGYSVTGQIGVYAGVRIMGPGYVSSNHLVGTAYHNYPRTFTTSSAGGHTHTVVSYHMHMPLSGLARIPNLLINTYTIQLYIHISTNWNFVLDTNDQLLFKIAEV